MLAILTHWSEDGAEHRDCFVNSEGVVRLPYGLTSEETVTHWAELPTLPGGMTHLVLGEGVQSALQTAWGARPVTWPAAPSDHSRDCLALSMGPGRGHQAGQ